MRRTSALKKWVHSRAKEQLFPNLDSAWGAFGPQFGEVHGFDAGAGKDVVAGRHHAERIAEGRPLSPLVGRGGRRVGADTAAGLRFGDDAAEGVVSVGGREPFRIRHRGEAASATLRILIASSESQNRLVE